MVYYCFANLRSKFGNVLNIFKYDLQSDHAILGSRASVNIWHSRWFVRA